jgi:Zn-dependent protease
VGCPASARSSHPAAAAAGRRVGPLTRLLLGAAFWVLDLPLAAAGVGGMVVGTVCWQALMNLILAIVNLLPGAPLDCGRMLQAILWRRHGHRTRPR